MNILEIKGLKKVYGTGEARVEALKGIDMQVERGEFVAVVGTSGSGKSTFLNMVGALDVPTEGQILVDVYKRQSGRSAGIRQAAGAYLYSYHKGRAGRP